MSIHDRLYPYWILQGGGNASDIKIALTCYSDENNDMPIIHNEAAKHVQLQPIIYIPCHLRIKSITTLRWRHNGGDSVSNHQPHDCLLNRLFRRRSKNTSKLRVTGLCVGNSPGTGEFPAQMASNAENASIWWRNHDILIRSLVYTLVYQPHVHTTDAELCLVWLLSKAHGVDH